LASTALKQTLTTEKSLYLSTEFAQHMLTLVLTIKLVQLQRATHNTLPKKYYGI